MRHVGGPKTGSKFSKTGPKFSKTVLNSVKQVLNSVKTVLNSVEPQANGRVNQYNLNNQPGTLYNGCVPIPLGSPTGV